MPPVKGKMFMYSKEQMEAAFEEASKGLPVATAARKYKVPRATLMNKIKGISPRTRRMGPPSILNENEEKTIVRWILTMTDAGFPVSRKNLLDSVQHLITELKRENPFTDNRPSRSWYQNFLRRNPEVSMRTTRNPICKREPGTKGNLAGWFEEVQDYLKQHGYDSILRDPNRVFSGDETAIFLNPTQNTVLAGKDDKTIYQQVNSYQKECVTVFITGNAAGNVPPPMVIFKYSRIPADIAASVPSAWAIGKSETGWMTSETFFEYITNIFHPWLVSNSIALPIILFIDGHGASHLTLHTSKFCEQQNIILVGLHPDATHQPMDVAVFSSLKEGWKEKVKQWRTDNYESPILKKVHFCPLFEKLLNETISATILKNGFRKCGLVPWNPNIVELPAIQKPKESELAKKEKELKELTAGLSVLEKRIENKKLIDFKLNNVWQGDLADLSLFNLYKKICEDLFEIKKECSKLRKEQRRQLLQNSDEETKDTDEENLDRDIKMTIDPETVMWEKPIEMVKIESNLEEVLLPEESIEHVTVDPLRIASSTKSPGNQNAINKETVDVLHTANASETSNAISSKQSPKSASKVNASSPFKKTLFWPEPKKQKSKRVKKEKIPSVATDEWQEY